MTTETADLDETADIKLTLTDTAQRNRDAGYTGLGIAEFAALVLHENRAQSGVTLLLLDVADETMFDEQMIALGRSSLAARGIIEVIDEQSFVPVGIGSHVVHATAHTTMWMSVSLLSDTAPSDGMVIALAPKAGLIIVRRALASFQVAPTVATETPVDMVWGILEGHLAGDPLGTVSVTPAFMDGSEAHTILIRHPRVDEQADTTAFEVALVIEGDEGSEEPVTEVHSPISEEDLDALLARELHVEGAGDDEEATE